MTGHNVNSYIVENDISFNHQVIGKTVITYRVERYMDLRNSKEARSYKVGCTQRIVIPNATKYSLTPPKSDSFDNYPALLSNNMRVAPTSAKVILAEYSPHTLNTAVVTSSNESQHANQSTTEQHTSGSSTAQSNSYGGSASLGFFGDNVTGSISGNYEHTKTKSKFHSKMSGSGSESGTSSGGGDSFSIKDWGAYAFLDDGDTMPTWVWGQEYPWNIIRFRYCASGNTVELPQFVKDRMSDGEQVYPPSHLSLFGIDFTMKAGWIVTPTAGGDDTFYMEHALEYVTASHSLDSAKKVVARLTPSPLSYSFKSVLLDLCELALEPILTADSSNGAVVGFIENKFLKAPTSAAADYKIVSGDYNLLVSGSGFDSAMKSTFKAGGKATVVVQFKILDTDNEYTLYMKHWKIAGPGCNLKITCNGDSANAIEKSVQALESEGGESNLMSINLRNKNYATVDYHDLLQLGLNTVEIEITPEPGASCGYELRALAIGSA